MPSSLEDRLAAARRRRFVGRREERALFQEALAAKEPLFSVLYVFGPGGVGKSSLLREYATIASREGAPVAFLNGRNIEPRPDGFLSALREALTIPPEQQIPSFLSPAGRTVILIDTAELLTPIHGWLRVEFLPGLPDSVLVVLAGRHPPALRWRSDPGWQEVMHLISLRNFSPSESRAYLVRHQVPVEAQQEILAFTHGHPLALSLVADAFEQSPMIDFRAEKTPDFVQALLKQFLDEVSSPEQRRALEACSLVRLTTEPLLDALLQTPGSGVYFEWLQSLSFVESESGGLLPHDLARETLAADLRWRNPEWYEELHTRARLYYTTRLEEHKDPRIQRQMLSELIYLHRENPAVRSYFQWQSTGVTYTDTFHPGDREPVLAMVEAHEGPESARLAAHWLDRQEPGVSVFRQAASDVQGFLVMLALEKCDESDREIDPAVRQAWHFLQGHAPLRQNETAIFFRYWMSQDTYQAVSPVQSRIFLNIVQHYLTIPGLAYSLVYCADPDFWAAPFAYADLQRLPEADFTVGDRRYGLYGHDWRVVPPGAWLALLAEREMGADVTPAAARPTEPLLVLSESEFADAVHQALRDYVDMPALQTNPLLQSRLVVENGSPEDDLASRAETLQRILFETTALLKESPRQTKIHRVLYHTYLQPAPTHEQAAEILEIPYGSFRRYLRAGVQFLTEQLWSREIG